MDTPTLVSFLIAFVFALSFHEAAHAWSALKLGDTTARDLGRVTLNPIPHMDLFMTVLFPLLLVFAGLPPFGAAKPVPVDTRNLAHPKRDHALIAAAGPASNVLLALIAVIAIRLLRANLETLVAIVPDGLIFPVFQLLNAAIVVNLLLATFNMIPIPPLDGSWILAALLPGRVAGFYRALQPYGFFIIMALVWGNVVDLGRLFRPIIQLGQTLAGLG